MKKAFTVFLFFMALCVFATELEGPIAKYCFDDATGRISKIIDKRTGETPIESIFVYYNTQQNSGDRNGNEKSDRVTAFRKEGDVLVYECVNPKLAEFKIIKRYWMENDALRREMTFINTSKEKIFLLNSTEVAFSEPFLKEAYYFGAGYLGPYEPAPRPKTYVRVDQYVQTSKGMVLSNHNPKLGSFTNYRVKINDNVVYPWWQSTIGRYREDSDRLYYTPRGWSMCMGTLDVEPNGGQIRYTDCFSFFPGDISNFFYDVFGKDADFKRDLASISNPPEWVLDVLCCLESEENYLKYITKMCDEGMILAGGGSPGDWADYRWEDGYNGISGGFVTANEAREFTKTLHDISPRLKLSHYGIAVAADIYSPIMKDHPEWFRKYNRKGTIDSLFPGLRTNFQTMYNREDCRHFMAHSFFDNARDFGYDMIYLDEAQQHNTINWQTMELIRDDHVVDFWKQMRRRSDQEKIPIFMNGSGQPYADINYMEAVLRMQSAKWREFAGVAQGLEWFSLFRPTSRIIPLYWYPRRIVDYHNRCLALGWIPRPQANFKSNFIKSPLATIRAAYETGKTLPVPVKYTPDWKTDPKAEVESYSVRRLNAEDLLFSFISRCDQKTAFPVSIDMTTMGFKQNVNVWLLPQKYCTEDKPEYTLSDKENKANYAKYGWQGGTITYPVLIYSGRPDHTLELTLPEMVRDDMVQILVTPGSAALYTIDNLPLNYFYTKRPRVEIKGNKIISERDAVEIILADMQNEFTDITLNGKPAKAKTVDVGGALFQVVKVPKGTYTLNYKTAPKKAAGGKAATPVVDGRTLSAQGASGLYAIDLNGRTLATVSLPYTLPEQFEDGAYTLRPAGTKGGKPFTLKGGKPCQFSLADSVISHKAEVESKPLDIETKGVKILSQTMGHGAWYEKNSFQNKLIPYIMEVKPEILQLTAGSSRRERGGTQGLIPPVFAGLEMQGVRQLSVTLDNTYYDRPNIRSGSSDYYYADKDHNFIGIVVDYSVNGKYTKRVDFSVGGYNSAVKCDYPHWGANKVQDQIIYLGNFIEEGPKNEFSLDLTKYAPEGWDGKVFLNVGSHWYQPNRWLTLTIRGFNNEKATDFIDGFDAANTKVQQQVMPKDLALPKIKKAPSLDIAKMNLTQWAKIPTLLPYIQNNDKILEMPTDASICYTEENLYIVVHCVEKSHAPSAESSQPWRNDCIEFYFVPSGEDIRQIIIDANNNIYKTNCPEIPFKSATKTIAKDGWYVLLELPWKMLGMNSPNLGAKIRFNIIRNRIGSRTEVSTWGPLKDSYREIKYYGTITIGDFLPGQGRYEEMVIE